MVLVRESVKHVTVSDDWLRVESYNNVEYVYSSLYDFENRNCIEPSLESSGVLDKDGIAKLVRNSRGCQWSISLGGDLYLKDSGHKFRKVQDEYYNNSFLDIAISNRDLYLLDYYGNVNVRNNIC